MRATDLKKWKEAQREAAIGVVDAIASPASCSIKDVYPEFDLGKVYTTSLDPHVPIWALLPFFEKVVVGVLPYLKDEQDFLRHYGLTTRQILSLHEKGRVELRVLFPSRSTVPRIVDPFLTRGLPSTIRDRLLVERMLGPDRLQEFRCQFQRTVCSSGRVSSVDGLSYRYFPTRRAYNTCEAVYLQLHAHGYGQAATEFEGLYQRDQGAAIRWLEACRLFLVGPIHYSLMGIHCVPENSLGPARESDGMPVITFPSELGRILVEVLGLIRVRAEMDDFGLRDCLAVYPEFDEARQVLFALRNAIAQGVEDLVIRSAEDLRRLIRTGRSRTATWLRILRLVLATGISACAVPFEPTVGLLSGLGFGIATEFWSEKVNKLVRPVAQRLPGYPPEHLSLLVKLDEDVKRHFQYEPA